MKVKFHAPALYRGIAELRNIEPCDTGRIRKEGGGRKRLLPQHPEWIETFQLVIEPYMAGLPQDENVFWISLTVPQIREKMNDEGADVTDYIVRQILDRLGFRRRSFVKDLPMKDVADRDAQFVHISEVRKQCEKIGLPIISIDTKKKELVDNFKREGKALSIGQPRSLDHDFKTFSDGQIVPHGILMWSETGHSQKSVGGLSMMGNSDFIH